MAQHLEECNLRSEVQNKLTAETRRSVRQLLERTACGNSETPFPVSCRGHAPAGCPHPHPGHRSRNPPLDEAFSALDYQTRLVVSDEVKKIICREGKTAILVTHDISEAISMADDVVVLTKRPGTIKSIHKIVLTCQERTPIKCREAPEFRDYFNLIWKELDIHVQ